MLKLFGRKVKPTYSLQKGLCSVYGIGETTSKDICSDLGLNPSLKISKVTLEEEGEIQAHLVLWQRHAEGRGGLHDVLLLRQVAL